MPRSRRSTSRRGESRYRAESNSTPPTQPVPPDLAVKPSGDGSAADRYYAMAEAMNMRGAMELAVPFYRQAVALLLAERESLREQLGGKPASASDLPVDALHGLLEAAHAWDSQQDSAEPPAEPEDAAQGLDLEQRIRELAEDLSAATAAQVLAGLDALAAEAGGLTADGIALRGKALLLQGDRAGALENFEVAVAAAPERAEFQINCGAARLANGQLEGALELLRAVHARGHDHLSVATRNALLRNLSAAESQAGNLDGALALRRSWVELDPEAVPLERWLAWAEPGLQQAPGSASRAAAIGILQRLRELAPDDRRVLEALATALEEQGDYKAASLLYRELLRPAMVQNLQRQSGSF